MEFIKIDAANYKVTGIEESRALAQLKDKIVKVKTKVNATQNAFNEAKAELAALRVELKAVKDAGLAGAVE